METIRVVKSDFSAFALLKKTYRIVVNTTFREYVYEIRVGTTFKIVGGFKRKQFWLNRYTLPFIFAIYNYICVPLITVFLVFSYPIYMYFEGAVNFYKNRACITNVRYFTWVTLMALIGCLSYIGYHAI